MLKSIVIGMLAATVTIGSLCGCMKEPSQMTEPSINKVGPESSTHQSELLQTGEVLFKQFCFSCHPDGGNVSDPEKSLRRSALHKNHINNPEDIVRIMRKPLSRMIRFDENTISEKDARAIAKYVLEAFR